MKIDTTYPVSQGSTWFLIRSVREGEPDGYSLHAQPGATHADCHRLNGPLGTTLGMAEYACGMVAVEGVQPMRRVDENMPECLRDPESERFWRLTVRPLEGDELRAAKTEAGWPYLV